MEVLIKKCKKNIVTECKIQISSNLLFPPPYSGVLNLLKKINSAQFKKNFHTESTLLLPQANFFSRTKGNKGCGSKLYMTHTSLFIKNPSRFHCCWSNTKKVTATIRRVNNNRANKTLITHRRFCEHNDIPFVAELKTPEIIIIVNTVPIMMPPPNFFAK